MNPSMVRSRLSVSIILGGLWLPIAPAEGAQAPGSPSPAPTQGEDRAKLTKQVDELRQAGKFDEAIPVAERILDLERRSGGGMTAGVAEALSRLAVLHELRGDWTRALARCREALGVRERVNGKDHWRTADARLAVAFAAKVAGLGAADRARLQGTLRREQEAARLAAQGQYAEVERAALAAMETYRAMVGPETVEVAQLWHLIGLLRRRQNDARGVREATERALAIFRKALPPGHPDIASSLINLGVVRAQLGEYAGARASYEEALAIRRKALPKDHPDIASSLYNLGNVQRALGEYAGARASHAEALAIYRQALPSGHPDIAQSLNNLGNVQRDLREYAAARASHEEALAIRRKALPPGHPDIAHSLNNLGVVQRNLREYSAARANLEEALAIRRKALPKDHPDLASSLNNLGNVQRDLREYAAAKANHAEALAIRRKALPPGHPNIADSLNNLGNVQRNLREYAAARASHEEALAIYRKALPEGHPNIAFSLDNLARVGLASGVDVGDAIPRLIEASDLLQADQLRLAVVQAEPEQFATGVVANRCLRSLIDAALITRRNPGLTYDRAVRGKGSVTAQQRWARQARDTADPQTARLLDRLRQVTQQIVGLSVGERPSDRSSEPRDIPALLRALSDERSQLERQLTERSAVYRTIQARARVGVGAVRAALPKGTALIDLVEYHHVESPAQGQGAPSVERRLAVFVVRPERQEVALVPLGPSLDLAELSERWRASYGAGKMPPAGVPDPGAALRKRLWEPLAKHLEGVRVVLVSPDGPLNGLPWAALPGSEQGTFLVHEYAFAVVPIPQLLPELLRDEPRRGKEPPSLLLAGGIDFGEETTREAATPPGKLPPVPTFRPLPGAESEVNDLRTQFEDTFPEAPAPKVLRKDKATKPAIMLAAPGHRFLHLATHGFFADGSEESAVEVTQRAELLRGGIRLHAEAAGRHPGLLSGLVFAGVNRPDRRPEETVLTALEAAELELGKVELVVLSACETGRGRVAGGEGVLGLQRAFQLAGARSVVASLWKVPDEETHQLMREFYRRVWSKDPISKAEALRQAQLWMLENWKPRGTLERPAPQGPPSPYYWAAFVLSGDWR
jgi:CHAT domain-containing protein/tetratricopeptide (TPR) repeat protein